MKVFTVAAALAGGALKPTETIYCEDGNYSVDNVIIHDTHENEWLTPTQILAKSSNIGALEDRARARRAAASTRRSVASASASRRACRSPARRPACCARAAARGSRSRRRTRRSVRASASRRCSSRSRWPRSPTAASCSSRSSSSKISDARGDRRQGVDAARAARGRPRRRSRRPSRRCSSPSSKSGGTGVEAAMPGFRVAGKTATAQKVDPATGKYSEDKYTASFVGFVPAEKPRLVIAVVLDEPMIGRYGGDLAGPVFRRVAEASLRYLGVPPSHSAPKIKTVTRTEISPTPTLAAMKVDGANAASAARSGASPTAAACRRRAGRRRRPAARRATVRVPDATGMGARDAVRAVGNAGLVPLVEGTGRLVQAGAVAAARRRPRGRACVWSSSRRHDRDGRAAPSSRKRARPSGMTPRASSRARSPARRSSVDGDASVRVTGVHHDSRRVQPGDLFVVRRGEHARRQRVRRRRDRARRGRAPRRRAASAVAERTASRSLRVDDVPTGARVRRRRRLRAPRVLARRRRHHRHERQDDHDAPRPRRDRRRARRCPRAGSSARSATRFAGTTIAASHTTPEADELARVLAVMRKRGATHVVMEVSSIALVLGRVRGACASASRRSRT